MTRFLDGSRACGADPLIVFEGRGDGSFDGQHTYGAGQPSVTYVGGQFYLIFTETTGAGALPTNGAGQFAWRSSDPTFATGTEVFTAHGWQASTAENSRSFSVVNAFSADWQYSDEIESFVIAHNNDAGRTTLTFLGAENLAEHPWTPVNIDGPWVEGPGSVSTPDKHAVDDNGAECGRVPVDVMHASRADGVPPQDLVHKGIDLVAPIDCETPTPTPSPSTTYPTPAPAAPVCW